MKATNADDNLGSSETVHIGHQHLRANADILRLALPKLGTLLFAVVAGLVWYFGRHAKIFPNKYVKYFCQFLSFDIFCIALAFAIIAWVNKERLDKISDFLARHRKKITWSAFLFYGVHFSLVTCYRHYVFGSNYLDFTAMLQPMFNSTWENWMMMTSRGMVRSRLADGSVEMSLLILTPFYGLFPSPYWLLVLQAFVVGSSAFAINRITRFLAPENGILFMGAIVTFLVFDPYHGPTWFDFHPYTLIFPGALFLVVGLQEKNWRIFYLSLIYLCLLRNDICVVGFPLALVLLLYRQPKHAFFAFFITIGYFIWSHEYFSPQFGAFPKEQASFYKFGRLGSSGTEIATYILTHPLDTIYMMFFEHPRKFSNFLSLIWISMLIPLLVGFEIAFLATCSMMIFFLLENPSSSRVNSHHMSAVHPYILAGIIIGSVRLSKLQFWDWFGRMGKTFSNYWFPIALLCAMPLLLTFDFKRFGGSYTRVFNYRSIYLDDLQHYQTARDFVRQVNETVPYDKWLQVASNFSPHVAHRAYIATMSADMRKSDFIFGDLKRDYSELSSSESIVSRLRTYLKGDYGFRVIRYEDGIFLIDKKTPLTETERAQNLAYLEQMIAYERMDFVRFEEKWNKNKKKKTKKQK